MKTKINLQIIELIVLVTETVLEFFVLFVIYNIYGFDWRYKFISFVIVLMIFWRLWVYKNIEIIQV